ncbi:hypothetical protein IU427_33325 [Nocardia beijingensis]|uniref:hypothetical protein n=1 Tax=Nocardia beijingensis TaxID=95162 RepID=UPI0018930857|nr:hypothetical protein [Nocardia beijingensis]MBF6470000.1 hypothetical protein [Nocardia beijingensis]
MSTDVAFPVQITAWTVFWAQLPVLVLVVAVIVVAITALRRARTEDVPKVFEAFALGFGPRLGPPPLRRPRSPQALLPANEE